MGMTVESNSLPVLHVQKEYHIAHHYQFTVQLFSFLLAVGNRSNIFFCPQKYNYNDMQLLKISPFVSFQHLLLTYCKQSK